MLVDRGHVRQSVLRAFCQHRSTERSTSRSCVSSSTWVWANATPQIAETIVASSRRSKRRRRNSIGKAVPAIASHAEAIAARNGPLAKLASSEISGKHANARTSTPGRRLAGRFHNSRAASANAAVAVIDASLESQPELRIVGQVREVHATCLFSRARTTSGRRAIQSRVAVRQRSGQIGSILRSPRAAPRIPGANEVTWAGAIRRSPKARPSRNRVAHFQDAAEADSAGDKSAVRQDLCRLTHGLRIRGCGL